ncbi:MAG: PAS domain-containing protein [Lentisphaerae bacterium]|nr:PAS domain-containing protein [Lentisphaerota bacterium]
MNGNISWSDELYRLYGVSPDTFTPTAESFIGLIHPDDRSAMQTWIAACAAGEKPDALEFRINMPDGTIRFIRGYGEAVHDAEDKLVFMAGIGQDITESKSTEKALQASEQEFRSLAEAMPQIVWITRPDGWNIYFNQQWVDYTGLTLEESYGHGWNTPFHPDDRKRAWDAWENATQDNGIYSIESRLRRADGVYRWWLVRGVPLSDANGKILKWFGTCTDIEYIKQAEAALRESERFAQATVDALLAHIAVLDDTGTIIAVNHAWRAFAEANGPLLSNVNEGANCLSVCDAANGPYSEEATTVAAGIRAVISGEKSTFEIEYPCHSPDTKRWFVCRVSRFPGPDTAHIVISHENITERKLLELEKSELEEQNRQLQKSESLGRMAGSIAHHFNNQLSVVQGYLEMVIGDLPANDSRTMKLAKAMQAAREASEVSGLLLAYLGQIHGKLESLDLAKLCRMSLPVIQAGKPENVVLETDLPSPGPYVNADAKHIQQILSNLMINAWEAIGDGAGPIHLSVKTVSPTDIPASHRFPIKWRAKEQNYACLEVKDSGCGIREKDIDKIFDPFYSTKFTGRGLGLPVVLGIVKAHDSVITVENRINGGSVFKVFFPLSTQG